MFSRADLGTRSQVPRNVYPLKKSPSKSSVTSEELDSPQLEVHSQQDNIQDDPSLIKSFGGHKGAISAVALSHDLNKMASCSVADTNLFIWRFDPELEGCKYGGHQVCINNRY